MSQRESRSFEEKGRPGLHDRVMKVFQCVESCMLVYGSIGYPFGLVCLPEGSKVSRVVVVVVVNFHFFTGMLSVVQYT